MKEQAENNIILEVRSGEEQILYQGAALHQEKDGKVLLKYTEPDGTANRICFSGGSCAIHRKGKEDIRIHLDIVKPSYLEIAAEEGELRIPVRADRIIPAIDRWSVAYTIASDAGDLSSFDFSWSIKEHIS